MLQFLRIKIFLSLFFISHLIYGQFYQIRNYNPEHGLPSPEIYGMMQDSKGFMWFATDMGVSRYNGYEFKNYNTENGMPDNTAFGFCEDSKGRVWFRSFSGKLSYFLNDSVYSLPCNSKLESEIKKTNIIILSIYVDDSDTIWLGTTDKFVIKIAPPFNNNSIEFITLPEDGEYLFILTDKELIFGGSSSEKCPVTAYTKYGKKIVSIDLKLQLPAKTKYRFFGKRLANGDFIASVNNSLLRFNSTGLLALVSESDLIISLFEDKDGNIIVAANDGIKFHDKITLKQTESILDFSGKIFTEVIIDRENALWASSEGHGVFYIPFMKGRYYNPKNGLSQSKISCIGISGGKILTGHLDGIVTVIDKTNARQLNMSSKQKWSTAGSRIIGIYTGDDSVVYAGNNLETFKLSADLKNFDLYKNMGFKKIIGGKDEKTWILINRHILCCKFGKSLKIENDLQFDQYVDDIAEDRKGVLWIGAMNGLWSYSGNKLKYFGDENKLLRARVINIREDTNGRLWMATRGKGVIVKDGEKFYQILQENGLASNMCRELYIDSGNVVWVGSNNGLSKILMSEQNGGLKFSVDVYSKKQGLLTNEVNYIIRRGKEMVVAHNSGISIFDPAAIKNNSTPPPVYITGAVIGNSNFNDDSVVLPYSKNYLKINYVGLSYKNPGELEYRYKMEGLDTSWVYTNYPSAQFQTLNPGDYRFVVYAKNDDGYWSKKPAVLSLTVLPAWWQTVWFRSIVAFIIISVAYWIIKYRIDKIRKREREKSLLQNKIAETELKALRAQMNPHFIFNAINSVQHFITSNDPDSSQKYLSKFAKLIRYVVDNSKPSAIPISKEIEAITLFLELEAVRFENRFEYFIEIDKEIERDFVNIPSMLIQPYIENAIWHGLMHKEGKGKIMVKIELLEQGLKCTVEDNGIGRKKSMEIKSEMNVKKHKSVGMTITQERLEIINQVNNSHVSVNIIDMEDEKKNACGTRVELFMPSL